MSLNLKKSKSGEDAEAEAVGLRPSHELSTLNLSDDSNPDAHTELKGKHADGHALNSADSILHITQPAHHWSDRFKVEIFFNSFIKALLLIGPAVSICKSTSLRKRARLVACFFMKFLGQLMMIVCDVLIMQRMSQGGGINIIVSMMCPVFHIYVAVLNAMSPSAYKKLQRCVLSQKVTVMSTPGNAAKLSLAQRAITFLLLLSCAAMFLLFVLFTPLFAPKNVDGSPLSNLASLHRLWISNPDFYTNSWWNFFYSLGLLALGFVWVGVVGAFSNACFVAWLGLKDVANLVDEMKSSSAAAPLHHNPTPDSHADAAPSSSSDSPQRVSRYTPASNEAKDADSDLQTKLDVIVSKLLVAVDASLESRRSMKSFCQLCVVSLFFDVILITLFLVMTLLITSCSKTCVTFGTTSWADSISKAPYSPPCVYTRDTAISVALWFFGMFAHIIGWLLPLCLLNRQVNTIREKLVTLPLDRDGTIPVKAGCLTIPRPMRRFLESHEFALLVQVYTSEHPMIASYSIPFFGIVSLDTLKFFIGASFTLYGLVYPILAAAMLHVTLLTLHVTRLLTGVLYSAKQRSFI